MKELALPLWEIVTAISGAGISLFLFKQIWYSLLFVSDLRGIKSVRCPSDIANSKCSINIYRRSRYILSA
jgi:hypothetical protein